MYSSSDGLLKRNVQNVLCLVCALHFKGSPQENGSCQHLQTYSNKMQPYWIKKHYHREKNHITLSLKTPQNNEETSSRLPTHTDTLTALSLCLLLGEWKTERKKKKTTPASSCRLRLVPQTVACLRASGFCEACRLFICKVQLTPLLFSTTITYAEFPGAAVQFN